MELTPFDYESIVIGITLRYGTDAPRYVLPDLSHDKFIHSKEGGFDSVRDHALIWRAVEECWKQKIPPSPSVIAEKLGNRLDRTLLQSYVQRTQGYYGEYEFSPERLQHYAERVDAAGVMYQTAARSKSVADILLSPEAFAKSVSKTRDVDVWVNAHVKDVSGIVRNGVEGYKHISASHDELRDYMQRVRSGENLAYVQCGLPSLAYALPVASLVVIQGMSNSGKSMLTHEINLGTAIGLQELGLDGCVVVNSLEEREFPLKLKWAGQLAGINIKDFKRNQLSERQYRRLCCAMDYIETLPLYIDSSNVITTDIIDMRVMALHHSEAGPVRQLSVDYLEVLDWSSEKAENKEQALASTIAKLGTISRLTEANVLVICQSTYDGNKHKIAGMEGTRASRAILHRSDVLYEWYNPVAMKERAVKFETPEGLNDAQPWLLTEKTRDDELMAPVPMGWVKEWRRVFDMNLPEGQLFTWRSVPDFSDREGF